MSDAWMEKMRDPCRWAAPAPLPAPIQIEELVVRLYRKGDGPALFEAIDADRDALLPWMAWSSTDHLSVDDSIHYVERARRAVEKPDCIDFPMGIFDNRDGSLVGGTGLHRIRPSWREAEIGYWVRGDRQRRGICTRAIGALISSALRSAEDSGWGLRRIVIYNAVGNVGSRRVCERLGLRLEMRMRKERYLDVLGYMDMLGFAVLDDEWDFEAQRAKPNIGWSE
jgi:RimJ/RimL family protein N-acetyltransferase